MPLITNARSMPPPVEKDERAPGGSEPEQDGQLSRLIRDGIVQPLRAHARAPLPRALFVESGRNDRIFPIEGSRKAAAKTQDVFRTLRAAESHAAAAFS